MTEDVRALAAAPDVATGSTEIPVDAGTFERVASAIADGRDRWVRGLVTGPTGEVVLVRNRWSGGWVLPGGTVEPDERPREALRRELAEETGLAATVEEPLAVETRTFVCDGRAATGQCAVYAARASATELRDDPGVDDAEIREVGWFGAVPADGLGTDLAARLLADRL